MKAINDYQEVDLGNVSLRPKGEYTPGQVYEYLDLVNLNGSSYCCAVEATSIAPAEGQNSREWQYVALSNSNNNDEIDIGLGVSGATVGQIIEVEQVDESGKPTKWKVVDKPSNGKTPVKGVDYGTPEDKATIVTAVLAELARQGPHALGGVAL